MKTIGAILNSKKLKIRIINAIFGINLLCFGLGYELYINFGMSPFDTFSQSIQAILKISVYGNAALLVQTLFFLGLILGNKKYKLKKYDFIYCYASIFILTRILNVYTLHFPYLKTSNFIENLIIFIFAFMCANFGLFCLLKSELLLAPFDLFVLSTSKVLNFKIGIMRLIIDTLFIGVAIGLIIVLHLGVTVSIGTIIITVCTGTIIRYFEHLFD